MSDWKAKRKALIHEMFGDGIMSAIDFELDIQRQEDPKGDRVVVTCWPGMGICVNGVRAS